MKRFIIGVQKHLGITRSEAIAVTFVATVLTIGTIGNRFWPTTSLHDHATAERIAQMLDSLESDRVNPNEASDVTSEPETTHGGHQGANAPRASKTPRVIDPNTATISELESLPGIGPAMAQRIVEARKRRPFTSAEDLLNVKGIGEKKFAKLLPYVKVP
jgi:competence protein ComEA